MFLLFTLSHGFSSYQCWSHWTIVSITVQHGRADDDAPTAPSNKYSMSLMCNHTSGKCDMQLFHIQRHLCLDSAPGELVWRAYPGNLTNVEVQEVVFPIFSPLADVILLQLTLRSCLWNYIAGCLQGASPHPSVTDTFPQMEQHLHQLLTNYHFRSFSELKIPGRMWLFIKLTVMSFGSPSFGAQHVVLSEEPWDYFWQPL